MNYTKEQIAEIYSGWFNKLQSIGRDCNEFINVLIRASKFYFDINEEWESIYDFEGLYKVSNFGRVKSLKFNKERILKQIIDSSGYYFVGLCKNNNRKTRTVHQLVTIAFLNHVPNGSVMVVNHKDFIRINNHINNLEIVTMRENTNQKHLNSSSKYTGVSWNKRDKKWQSNIYINDKLKYLGYFKCEYKAHLAYQNELNKLA